METRTCKCCGKEKPVGEFYKNRIGYTNVCRECASEKRIANRKKKNEVNLLRGQLEEKRKLALADFQPRELMAELKRRGYDFTMKFTEVHVISSKDIAI